MPTYVTSTDVAPMPNLENLRKQAKLYVRWHRERHHPVAAQIRAVLPRFRDLTDRQILDGASSSATPRSWWPARPASRHGRRSRQECRP